MHRIIKKYDGHINKQQFADELVVYRKKFISGGKSIGQQKIDGRKIKATEDEFKATNIRIVDNLFGNKNSLTEAEIIHLKQKMTEDLWNYEFFTYEPNEENKIDLESWLMSIIVCMHGNKVKDVKKRIKKVVKEMPEDCTVSYKEYIAFQHWLMQADRLKAKVSQYRYMDIDMFTDEISGFNKFNDYCKLNKVKVSELQTKACFMLLDSDDSGELESEEVMEILGDRQLLGQNREK